MWGIATGALLMAGGVVMVLLGSQSLHADETRERALVRESLVVSPQSAHYEAFASSAGMGYAMDAPTYMSFYVWNLTNAAHVLMGEAAPALQQLGPYTYEKRSRKVDVRFHASMKRDDGSIISTAPEAYQYVSYRVISEYTFVPDRSNGSERDAMVTINASYARRLAHYREHGYSERLLVAEMAQRHMESYGRHIQGEFVAHTKQRALQFYLPELVRDVRRESVVPAIRRQREQIDDQSIAANLVRMRAVARTEMIPRVLGDLFKDISDRFLPGILQEQLAIAKTHALPRVLSNLYTRLRVEGVPYLLQRQRDLQHQLHVPITLLSLQRKLPRIAFPYVLQEVYERACLEAVPWMLRSLKLGIIARDIADNVVQADVAQNNVVENWRMRSDAVPVDFDAWIDDAPTGSPRTGFELRPPTVALQLSKEAASLIIGSTASNKRFSIVDYDSTTAASYALDEPTSTPIGFGIWKQVIAMNETAIDYVIAGVNNDVALTSDFLTRDQILFIRDYLITWARGPVMQRDRERFWRQHYTKRTSTSDFEEPSVDLDIESVGTQTGFNLQVSGASTSSVTAPIAQQIWNQSDPFSFTSPQGFIIWYQAAVAGDATAKQQILNGVAGMADSHITEITSWITRLLNDGFITDRALRHWSTGTCLSVLKVPREDSSCLVYDLEPGLDGLQDGFEMNPFSNEAITVSHTLRDKLWDSAFTKSFLFRTSASNSLGYTWWLHAVRTGDTSAIVTSILLDSTSFTEASGVGIVSWLRRWITNDLNMLAVVDWWRTSTCLPRQILKNTPVGHPIVFTKQSICKASYQEVEQSSTAITTDAPLSPYSTVQRVVRVAEVTCEMEAGTGLYTKTELSYDLDVKEYSCEAMSTEISDDAVKSDGIFGFELAPLLNSSPVSGTSSSRPSLAAAAVLWDSTKEVSFLHISGFKQWVVDSVNDHNGTTTLMDAINAEITIACPILRVAGANSAIFNTTLTNTAAMCGDITLDQLGVISEWIRSQSSKEWVKNALLDQWRRGPSSSITFESGTMDIEPYRVGKQVGWELTNGCGCTLTAVDDFSVYSIPRMALDLWNNGADGHPEHAASFLTTNGYGLWSSLIAAIDTGDESQISQRKGAVAVACGLPEWHPWLDNVLSWLNTWHANDHLLRDVLGHWLYGTCSTSPQIKSIIHDPDPISTLTSLSTCPVQANQYTVSLNDSLDDVLAQASRPSSSSFFDAEVVEKSALTKPSKVVEVTESWVTCEPTDTPDEVKMTTKSLVSVKECTACNFLTVLASGSTADIPWVTQDATFEMNRSVSSPDFISIEVSREIWQPIENSNEWAFTTQSIFLSKWQPAIHHSDAFGTLETGINTAIVAAPSSFSETLTSSLRDVIDYLKVWESSILSIRNVGEAWLSSSRPYLDLDANLEGDQGGFELFSTSAWRTAAGSIPPTLPTLDQAHYLWDVDNAFSFLNTRSDVVDGLPIGFNAWKNVYDGINPSTEQLVEAYPLNAETEYSDANAGSLISASEREQLLNHMVSSTTLSVTQIRGIAAWLMKWSENDVLGDYLLKLWSTGTTPRGESGEAAQLDLSMLLPYRPLGSSNDYFTISSLSSASGLFATVPITALRDMWAVATPGSVVNPTTDVVWCAMKLANRKMCAYVLNARGELTESAIEKFATTVQPVLATDADTTNDGPITIGSNTTALAVQFMTQQFGIDTDQVLAIATWWRTRPVESVYFQILQLARWQSDVEDTLALENPLYLGFALSRVFPLTTQAIAPADHAIAVASLSNNPAMITTGSNDTDGVEISICLIAYDLVFTAWDSARPSSFLHPDGMKVWQSFAIQQYPRSSTAILSVIAVLEELDPVFADLLELELTVRGANVSCTIEAIANWLYSWELHPFTTELVNHLWTAPLAVSPLLNFDNASEATQEFRLESGVGSYATPSGRLVDVLFAVGEILLDATEPPAFHNFSHGFAIWRELLNCSTTNIATGLCESSELANGTGASTATRYTLALRILVQQLTKRIRKAVTTDEIEIALVTYVIPWLQRWLDHDQLLQFVVDHVVEVNPGLNDTDITFLDLAMVQFVNASVTQASYAVIPPADIDNIVGPENTSYAEHIGIISGRLTQTIRRFDASPLPKAGHIETTYVRGMTGFPELSTFCAWNHRDRVFAYDRATTCSLSDDVKGFYSISTTTAQELFSIFGDKTEWEIAGASTTASITTSRGALLIDAFLAQPYKSLAECQFLVNNLLRAYAWPESIAAGTACYNASTSVSNNEILLDLPLLEAAGFTPLSNLWRSDFQAFLRYAATKFEYEPRMLDLPTIEFFASNWSQSDDTRKLVAFDSVPLGGYIAIQDVSHALSNVQESGSSLWQTDGDFAASRGTKPRLLTSLVPLYDNDLEMLFKKDRAFGKLVGVDGETELSVLGAAAFNLNAVGATDGSQFTTAILVARRYSGATGSYPPSKLLFFWSYTQRLAVATYMQNITRFGVPLMRYAVTNWREPTSGGPSGLEHSEMDAESDTAFTLLSDGATAVLQTNISTSLNLSRSVNDLPLALSSIKITEQSPWNNRDAAVVDIDPVTGVVFHRQLTWQLSSRLVPSHATESSETEEWHARMSAVWLPLMWIREQSSVSSTQAANFASQTVTPSAIAPEKVAFLLVVGGAIVIVLGFIMACLHMNRARVQRRMRNLKLMSVAPTTDESTRDGKGASIISGGDIERGIEASPQVGEEVQDESLASAVEARQDNLDEALHTSDDILLSASSTVRKGSTSGRTRRRTAPSVPTIDERGDDTADVQQL